MSKDDFNICPACGRMTHCLNDDGKGNIIGCAVCLSWDAFVAVAKSYNAHEALDITRLMGYPGAFGPNFCMDFEVEADAELRSIFGDKIRPYNEIVKGKGKEDNSKNGLDITSAKS